MKVSKSQLGLPGGDEMVDIIDVKCDPYEADFLKKSLAFAWISYESCKLADSFAG